MLAPISMDSGNTPCKGGQITVDLGFVEVVHDTGKQNKHGPDIQKGKALAREYEEECDDDSSEGDITEGDEVVAESLIEAISPKPKQLTNPVEKIGNGSYINRGSHLEVLRRRIIKAKEASLGPLMPLNLNELTTQPQYSD